MLKSTVVVVMMIIVRNVYQLRAKGSVCVRACQGLCG